MRNNTRTEKFYRSRISRRNFIKTASMAAGALCLGGCAEMQQNTAAQPPAVSNLSRPTGVAVNDIHSQLNAAFVQEVLNPTSVEEVQQIIRRVRNEGRSLAIAGGRHSMGGQQFAEGALLVDTRGLNRVLDFDRSKGLLHVEAGIEWPELIGYLHQKQEGQTQQWAIVQKQTGADKFTLGGSLASNVHGRALTQKPIVGNVESFTRLDHEGELHECDRERNPELFRLAIGGYGLFGMIASVKL